MPFPKKQGGLVGFRRNLFLTLVPSDTQIKQETAKAQPWANHVEPTGFTNYCHQKVVMSVLQVKVVSDTSWTL